MELQRAQRIQENRRKMEQLGLLVASQGFAHGAAAPRVALEAGAQQAPRTKKRRVQVGSGWHKLSAARKGEVRLEHASQ